MRFPAGSIDQHLDQILRRGSANVGECGLMSRAMVMLTRSCEMRCSYCLIALSEDGYGAIHDGQPGPEWQRGLPPRGDMSKETLRSTVDLLMSSTRPRLGIQLFGGEPTRCWDTLTDGLRWAISHPGRGGRTLELLLTTNGTGLSPERIRELAALQVTVQLSLDGDRDANRFRRGHLLPHDQAIGKLLAAAEDLRGAELRWFMNATLPPTAAGELLSRYRWARATGIPALQLNYATGMQWTDEQMSAYLDGIEAVLCEHAANPAGLELMNWQNGADPVPLCGDVIVDVDGSVFQTGAVFHEKRFPALKPAYHLGHIGAATRFEELPIPLGRLWDVTKGALKPDDWTIFAQNVRFGASVDLAVKITANRLGRVA